MRKWRNILIACLCCWMGICTAQNQDGSTAPPLDTTGSDFIDILYAETLSVTTTKTDSIKELTGNVELKQDSIYIFCDKATVINDSYMVAQGNFTLQQGDSTTIFADSAEYSSKTKIADLFGNVSMIKGHEKLFTDQLSYNAETKVATYLYGATLTDDTTYLKSTRGYFYARTDDIFFRDSVVVVSPDFTLRSDTLQFNARSKIVTFLAPTLIMQDTARIYTESGNYDISNKLAIFDSNPQYVKNDQKAWADIMRYDGNIGEVTLIGNAHFEDSASVATAEVIRHNERTSVTVLEGNGFFRDERRTLTGDTITYDAKNEVYSTRGRSHIVDGNQILDADQVDYIKGREVGIATGHVIFQDTTEKMTVICEYAEHSKKRNYIKASGGRDSTGRPARPLMIREIEGDSLFISADTLLSYELTDSSAIVADTAGADSTTLVQAEPLTAEEGAPASEEPGEEVSTGRVQPLFEVRDTANTTDSVLTQSNVPGPPADSIEVLDTAAEPSAPGNSGGPNQPESDDKEPPRVILAYNDVRIFKSDLQALCDSLSYNSTDSLFRLYTGPVIWSDTSQFTANHVKIQLANERIDKIYLEENSFIINTPDEVFYNQIKGRNSTAFFDSSELRRVLVTGNAESVYYAKDDEDAYIGVNKTLCSEMKMIFGNNEVEGIVFYAEPKATLYPMKEADHAGLKMAGFNWQIQRRPRSVQDIITIADDPESADIPVDEPELKPDDPPVLPPPEEKE